MAQHKAGFVMAKDLEVVMEVAASNNTQEVMKPCPIFAGRGKEGLRNYKSKVWA